MARAVVDLPLPLSPTSASVSPSARVKETSSTACTCPTRRCSRPLRWTKATLRPRTSRRGIGSPGPGRLAGLRAARGGGEQSTGLRLSRAGEDLAHGPALDHPAGVHHRDVVGHLGDHAHVVGDEDECGTGLGLEIAQEAQDLGLDGGVECGGRLVGDQHERPAGDGGGDHHPLPHPARELVRVEAGAAQRLGDLDAGQELDRLIPCLAPAEAAMADEHGRDLVAGGNDGVQRAHRFLEDHPDPVAAHGGKLAL